MLNMGANIYKYLKTFSEQQQALMRFLELESNTVYNLQFKTSF